jgi:hypothetical protein
LVAAEQWYVVTVLVADCSITHCHTPEGDILHIHFCAKFEPCTGEFGLAAMVFTYVLKMFGLSPRGDTIYPD